ncbi:rhomboid family intramembrane serine protease [Actinotalea sp. K2]|uniref:rhomboid family intramembrane serine protease n=1 Tax=Actinotalea sp. K2 TaxID=2939438 RepID=UPI002017CEFE|nr:rhomboid family intramembrane serine protease [Actinotalea sp. K2]MCL3860775.1 rhomboid family intramembrane serine protease [Actinotalea sp. K2]
MSDQPEGGPAPAQVPVCPRHPDRVSYVRCQRCGRPTCAECQRPAAVGIHCVDCVREASRAAPQVRTAMGAPIRRGRPVVTLTIIGLCLASFVLQLTVGGSWTSAWAFAPFLGQVEPWRFLTAAFLHSTGALFHILFNMYALWLVGPYLEHQLGRARFITLYLLAAVGGSVGFLLFASPLDGSWFTAVVGASGAVFGLFGAVLVVLRRLGGDARQILVLLAINGVIGFVVPGIAWEAHLGGLLVGAGLGAAFSYAPRDRRPLVGIVAPVVVAAILLSLTLLKFATVPA